MSNSDEILKKCCRCEIIQVIENLNKYKNRKDCLYPLCISCLKDSYFKSLDKIKKYNEQKESEKMYILKRNEKQILNFV